MTAARIKVSLNGPYVVTGGVPISRQVIEVDEAGNAREWRETHVYETPSQYLLCRCGNSRNKPFCDDSHLRVGFDGSESPRARAPYSDLAREFDGPGRLLTDARPLCVHARFCNPFGTVWKLVEETDQEPVRRLFDDVVGKCPSGRLIAWNRLAAEAFEPELEPSIAVVEDPAHGYSGPLWVRGGIEIESGRRRPRVRAAQPAHALPLRRVPQQAVLRRHACRDRISRRLARAGDDFGVGVLSLVVRSSLGRSLHDERSARCSTCC